jgi:pimeloyl-ACP methyl ester carboxylesterase
MAWRFNLKVITEKYDEILEVVPQGQSDIRTLILRGEKSNYITESDFEEFQSRFSNLKIETIAEAGHWVHAEKPKEFFDAVLKFIQQN